jgi:peptide/nickel transport system permease protein
MRRWWIRLARQLGALAATVILGGVLTAEMVRHSPGFEADERLTDARLNAESRAAIRAERSANDAVVPFYLHHISGMLRGNWGMSQSLRMPIGELIRSRAPVTAGIMLAGVAGGWALAFVLALATIRYHVWGRMAGGLSIALLSVPVAALAVLIFTARGPIPGIMALILFPRLFDHLRNLLTDAYAQPHVVTARAMGSGPVRVLARHVLPICRPQLLALAGVSVSMAFGAAIPVETLCDLPGIGQLAWKAAVARDLPVIVTLTLLITVLTQAANAVSDWADTQRGAEA